MLVLYETQQGGGIPAATGLGGVVPQWADEDLFQLQTKLVEAIKGHDFNLAVNVAQSRQLADMCLGNIKKFGRSLVALKHGDFATAARQLGISNRKKSPLNSKDISGRWLELQYGWLPSLSDTYEAAKAYEVLTQERKLRISAKTERREKIDRSVAPDNYQYPGVSKIRGNVVCELKEVPSAGRTLGLMDPLSVAWEIVPYSFVIDWFLPVGSYLSNLAILPSLTGRFCQTTMVKTECKFASGIGDYAGKSRASLQINMQRSVFEDFPPALPPFTNSLKTAIHGRRIFNAAALVHQLL